MEELNLVKKKMFYKLKNGTKIPVNFCLKEQFKSKAQHQTAFLILLFFMEKEHGQQLTFCSSCQTYQLHTVEKLMVRFIT